LIRNKKGVISLGGIVSGAGSLIQSFFEVLPKPIKFVIFLILILLLGSIINFSLQIFGVFCDSADNPVFIGANVFSNAGLLDEIPDPETIGLEAIKPSSTQRTTLRCGFCTDDIKIRYVESGVIENITQDTCFYPDMGCIECLGDLVNFANEINILGSADEWCMGDARRKDRDEMSLMSKWFCGAKWFGRCEPPEHYYYDSAINQYVCEDETCMGITAGDIWDSKLLGKGASYLYPEGQREGVSYEKFAGITCKDLKPNITVYGIPIFDYRIWLFLMVCVILVGFYFKIKRA